MNIFDWVLYFKNKKRIKEEEKARRFFQDPLRDAISMVRVRAVNKDGKKILEVVTCWNLVSIKTGEVSVGIKMKGMPISMSVAFSVKKGESSFAVELNMNETTRYGGTFDAEEPFDLSASLSPVVAMGARNRPLSSHNYVIPIDVFNSLIRIWEGN